MRDEDLIKSGYHEFDVPEMYRNKNRVKAFSKKFEDEIGKKYYITVWKYHFDDIPLDDGYEFEVQLYKIGNHAPVDLTFFTEAWDIKFVEDYVDKIFSIGFEHYERWGE